MVYHSKTGNTKKIAEVIAKTLGVSAVPLTDVTVSPENPVDLLILGDGMYFGGMDRSTKAFIKTLTPAAVRSAAVFSTSGGSWPMGPSGLRKALKAQGIAVKEESFKCHGGAFGFVFASHPNQKDEERARAFAEHVAE